MVANSVAAIERAPWEDPVDPIAGAIEHAEPER